MRMGLSTLRLTIYRALAGVAWMAAALAGVNGASGANAKTALRAAVNPNTGVYTLQSISPAWTFTGSVPAPVQALHRTTGKDRIGAYRQVRFDWLYKGKLVSGAIRTYRTVPVAQFILTFSRHYHADMPRYDSNSADPPGQCR